MSSHHSSEELGSSNSGNSGSSSSSSSSSSSGSRIQTPTSLLALDLPKTCKYLIDTLPFLSHLRHRQVLGSGGGVTCTIHQFSHGQSNPTYLIAIDDNKHKLVLRKQPPGQILQGAHQVVREAATLDFLKKNSDVPVPTILHVCTSEDVVGSSFFVMEYVDGVIYNDVSLPALSAADRTKVYIAVSKVLADLHSIDATKFTSFRNSDNFCSNQISLWMKQYNRSNSFMKEEAMFPDINNLHAMLEQSVPAYDRTSSQSPSLVHGDFRIDNIIFDSKDPGKILAVLDWELASIGDRFVDLSYLCLPYYIPKAPLLNSFSLVDHHGAGIPSEEALIKSYLSHSSRKKGTINEAAALKSIVARSRQGNASRGREAGELFSKVIPVLAKRGVSLLSKESKESDKGKSTGDLSNKTRLHLNEIRQGFPISSVALERLQKLRAFMDDEVIPLEDKATTHILSNSRWSLNPSIESLKKRAIELNLWNFWMPPQIFHKLKREHPDWDWKAILPHGEPFSNLDYAYLAIESGRSLLCPEAINCSAPDTGNMEILAKFGTAAQRTEFLLPLLLGKTRSCFGMTEIGISSSDPTQLATVAVPKVGIEKGEIFTLSGKKWWTTGACHPHVSVCIIVAITDIEGTRRPHQRHTLFAVPMLRPGITVVRPLTVFGYDDAPHGHAEVHFSEVRLTSADILGQLGEGFALSQARLGPGRLHHCARLVGHCIRGIEDAVRRGEKRQAFGKNLLDLGANREKLARARIAQRQNQLVLLDGAAELDAEEAAHNAIVQHSTSQSYHKPSEKLLVSLASLKVNIPQLTQDVLDFAIQIHGGGGLSMDHPLAAMWAAARTLRLVDGPDEVHLRTISNSTIKAVGGGSGAAASTSTSAKARSHPGVGNSRL